MNYEIKVDIIVAEHADYNMYKHALMEPFEADELYNNQLVLNTRMCSEHMQHCYYIHNNKINYSTKCVKMKDIISRFFFIYTDMERSTWDDKYWFCIGQLKTNSFYFAYESGRSGTGFGLGEKSTIYFAKKIEDLLTYGIDNKQRSLISNNIEKRFIISVPKEETDIW